MVINYEVFHFLMPYISIEVGAGFWKIYDLV